jgi:hypothetical protein
LFSFGSFLAKQARFETLPCSFDATSMRAGSRRMKAQMIALKTGMSRAAVCVSGTQADGKYGRQLSATQKKGWLRNGTPQRLNWQDRICLFLNTLATE